MIKVRVFYLAGAYTEVQLIEEYHSKEGIFKLTDYVNIGDKIFCPNCWGV